MFDSRVLSILVYVFVYVHDL